MISIIMCNMTIYRALDSGHPDKTLSNAMTQEQLIRLWTMLTFK